MQDTGDYVTDFHLSIEPMRDLGWEVVLLPWRSAPDWDEFEAVYVCTPWDYPQHIEEFRQVLASIEASRAVLFNHYETIIWNLEKTYLRDVETRGEDIVPSQWFVSFDCAELPHCFECFGVDKMVIKPTVGANAKDTFVIQNPVDEKTLAILQETFASRAHIVQPFVENIRSEGEYSLFFFNAVYSHAILKTPKSGDFRVQEEHGSTITACEPPDALREVAKRVFSEITPLPVYGRGDWVRAADGRFLLMELELIEPSLYLRTDSQAATRFAIAFNQRFEELAGE